MPEEWEGKKKFPPLFFGMAPMQVQESRTGQNRAMTRQIEIGSARPESPMRSSCVLSTPRALQVGSPRLCVFSPRVSIPSPAKCQNNQRRQLGADGAV